ncbi:hypothetical protein OROMI_016422 [Orobanche minor]
MELVKSLHYTEIGGVYIKEEFTWKLLIDDKDLFQYIGKVASGATLDFYLDNTIDKDIEPMNQMQPHVVVRPRPAIFKAKVVTQKTFVTIQDYQQNVKKRVQQLLDGNDVNKSYARRKLSLDNDVTKDVNNGKMIENFKKKVQQEENEVNSALSRLTEYEQRKNKNVAENKAKLESMGLTRFQGELRVLGNNLKTKVNDARDEQEEEGTDEYNPNVSEEACNMLQKRKTKKVSGAGPTTRLRVNASVTHEKEKEVIKSVTLPPSPPLTKAMSDILPPPPPLIEDTLQRPQVLGNGSMATFLQVRARKQRNEPNKVLEKDVHGKDLDLAKNFNQEIEKDVPERRCRGITRMDKVHRRKPSERKLITLNNCFQPIASLKKVRSELNSFLGTIARGYVPLNYVNWSQVPETEKDAYWGFVLDKIANKPDKIPLEEFKALLVYWADEHTQEVASKNSTNRYNITDTHCWYNEFCSNQPRNETQKSRTTIKTKFDNIEKIITSNGESDTTDQLFCEAETSHGPTWLVGRHVKPSKKKEKNSVVYEDNFVQQLRLEIKEELSAEMEEKLNKKVQENLRMVLKKLGEANPSFNLEVEELYTSNSSDGENGTPVTEVTPIEGTKAMPTPRLVKIS